MRRFLLALSLGVPSLLAQGTPEAAEPNNSTATAGVLALGAQGQGAITAGDEDWFKITLTTASDLKVWTGPGFAGQIDDTRVRIYAADGTTILIDVDDGSLPTHGYYSTFVVGNYAAGDYYVAVRGFSGTTTGTYTLDVIAAAPGTYVGSGSTPITEAPEDNDPRNTNGVATQSVLNSVNSGNIATGASGTGYTVAGADYDFFQVVVTSPGILSMSTAGGPAPTATDTVIHFVDAGLTRLAFDDDSGPSTYSQLSYTVTTPGLYYVAVSDWATGNYVLNITFSPLLGVAATTVQTGGCSGSAGLVTLTNRATVSFPAARPEQLVLGSTFYLDTVNVPANSLAIGLLGLGTLPAPVDLTALGAPGCLIEVNPAVNIVGFANATGVWFWGMPTPVNTGLIGLTLEQQVASFDAAANTLGIAVSNRVSSVAGFLH